MNIWRDLLPPIVKYQVGLTSWKSNQIFYLLLILFNWTKLMLLLSDNILCTCIYGNFYLVSMIAYHLHNGLLCLVLWNVTEINMQILIKRQIKKFWMWIWMCFNNNSIVYLMLRMEQKNLDITISGCFFNSLFSKSLLLHTLVIVICYYFHSKFSLLHTLFIIICYYLHS